jgi:hypothetical protein
VTASRQYGEPSRDESIGYPSPADSRTPKQMIALIDSLPAAEKP